MTNRQEHIEIMTKVYCQRFQNALIEGQVAKEDFESYLKELKVKLENKTDMQLQNLVVMNCC